MHGNFGHAYTQTSSEVEQINVECKSLNNHAMEEKTGHWSAECLEPALGVADSQACEGVNQAIEGFSHQSTPKAVTFDTRSRYGARANCHVDIVNRRDEKRDLFRIDGHVCVHECDDRRMRSRDSVTNGRSLSRIHLAPQDMKIREGEGEEVLSTLRRVVGAAVVNHDQFG